MTYTHTYSDGSQIELGSEPGKGWIAVLKQGPDAVKRAIAPRQITGRKAILVDDMTKPGRSY